MAVVIALSNYLVQFPLPHDRLGNWLTFSAFSYPIAFLIEDVANRTRGIAFAKRIVFFGFIVGVILSFATAPIRIAVASGSTFLVSGLCNVLIFHRLRHMQWWQVPLISTALSSVLDSAMFFSLAFAGTQTPWAQFAMGDLAVKLLMSVLFLPFYRFLYPLLGASPKTA